MSSPIPSYLDPSLSQVARLNYAHKLQTGDSFRLQEVTMKRQLFHPTTEIAANDEFLISHCNINTLFSKQVVRRTKIIKLDNLT